MGRLFFLTLRHSQGSGFLIHPDLSRQQQQMLQTSPRKRSIHKLFASLTASLFPTARRYSEETFLTSMLKDFTLASFLTKNPISLVAEVLIRNVVFVSTSIIQGLKL